MSEDTSIGIGKFINGYSVSGVVQAIDNIYRSSYIDTNEEHKEFVEDFFFGCPMFKTYEDAHNYCKGLEATEYGIIDLGYFNFKI